MGKREVHDGLDRPLGSGPDPRIVFSELL